MPCGRAEVATDLDAGASSCSEKPAGSDGRRPRRLARDGFWGGGVRTRRGDGFGEGAGPQEAPRSRRAATRRTGLQEAGLAVGGGRRTGRARARQFKSRDSCGNVYWADFSSFSRVRP